jgi:protein-S-isoprenylcysteine O-methyltransferase Ste14
MQTSMDLRTLVGSGDKIALFTLPFLIVGVILYAVYPSLFDVGGPPSVLRAISVVVLIVGVTIWIWSVVLILKEVPRGELITTGPFSLVKHPIYTSVSLLVIPAIGFLLDTWLWAVIGIAMYIGSRIYAPAEEAALAETFGARWDSYRTTVKIPWL